MRLRRLFGVMLALLSELIASQLQRFVWKLENYVDRILRRTMK